MNDNRRNAGGPGYGRPALSVIVAGLLLTAVQNQASADYPTRLTRSDVMQLVMLEARAMDVPAHLALAVAHAESNFDPAATSHKGARGVMQIMPATARGEYGIAPSRLWNPRINIRLGLHFLRRLIVRYRGRTDLALSYYNGGSRVGPPGRARVLPATKSYVRKVHSLATHYRRLLAKGKV